MSASLELHDIHCVACTVDTPARRYVRWRCNSTDPISVAILCTVAVSLAGGAIGAFNRLVKNDGGSKKSEIL